MSTSPRPDALLLASFGGPEGPNDVDPFLKSVTAGKRVPEERLREVAKHYEHFGGVSPINQESRAMVGALLAELNAAQLEPAPAVYWGNRHWHPLLRDVLEQMAEDNIQRAAVLVASVFRSPASFDVYVEEIEQIREAIGPPAPEVMYLQPFAADDDYIALNVERLGEAMDEVEPERRETTHILFTAHSIPTEMAEQCEYVEQYTETCRRIAGAMGMPDEVWSQGYQSRSGRPSDPWLEPDIQECVRNLAVERPITDVVVVPVGFLVEHMEVVYDLDVELAACCKEIGVTMHRAQTIGADPAFAQLIRKLYESVS